MIDDGREKTSSHRFSLVDRCSQWNTSAVQLLFGETNDRGGNHSGSLNLSLSYLHIDQSTNMITVLDDYNRRIIHLNLNQSNPSRFIDILLDSSDPGNFPTDNFKLPLLSAGSNNSFYVIDRWKEQIYIIRTPLHYGDQPILENRTSLTTNHSICGATVTEPSLDLMNPTIYLSDCTHHRILQYHFNGSLTVFVGNGQPGSNDSELNQPTSMVIDDQRGL